ncbi:diguanylate cyclase/phosphodiesterase (GGDEF & EAL domains) with PAS/PAC sensor(s) [Thioalkalivibrio nitratireducens DSM 14787]|uniref:Diguanylate cyclase/phosphodiesterase (GGDEF & EAL domains) with PAS/PAC sensor(S) n=1 Tax=Thioalkalivibrio nitratireducens (strain DSM 14787 / UNIQEM 213 / ALEN2) TaxID=1255043 RepID=L0DVR6_THIND|nr:diguanylate cyclase [Thioalkalivibrio nitratireducens]AGA33075.1 diguanylate cyclase/phosphodiesterase (GGDEF & EAL domains) with PAS/PAC sensor(s) [Thioalkalivibrio nitratireducens DSM 14787]
MSAWLANPLPARGKPPDPQGEEGLSESASRVQRSHWLDQAVILLLGAVMLGVGGFWADHWWAQGVESDLRRQLLAEAVAIARTVNPERVAMLSFDASDAGTEPYERMRQQLTAYREVSGVRGIYTIALRDGQPLFGPESYAADDPQYSPPGTPYLEPPAGLDRVFSEGYRFTAGPYSDEYGRFVTALAPVIDPGTGEVLVALGIDIEAADWAEEVQRARAMVWVAVFALLAIVLGGWSVVLSRDRVSSVQRWGLRNVEVWLAVVFGLAMTLIASLTLHAVEARAQHAQFTLLGDSKAVQVMQEFHTLRDHQFQALADALQQLETIDAAGFRVLTRAVLSKPHVVGAGWARRVARDELPAFEADVREAGVEDFQVFETDADGEPQPLSPRETHFPLRFVEPARFHPLIGFDMASEAEREQGIAMLRRTGLPSASSVVPTADAGDDVMLAYAAVPRPEWDGVRRGGDAEFATRGVAIMAMCVEALLRSIVTREHPGRAPVVVELYQLAPGSNPRYLASSSSHLEPLNAPLPVSWPASDRFVLAQPLFVFGRGYVLKVRTTPEYHAANPSRIGWSTALLGTLLTLLAATLVQFLIHRRARLEAQVQARTAELSQSESRYRQVVDNIREVAFQIDNDGRLVFLNTAWEAATGFPVAESLGTRLVDYVHAGDREGLQRLLDGMTLEQGGHSHDQFRWLCRDGRYCWLEITARAGWDVEDRLAGAFGTLEDVTERRNREEAIRRLAFHDALTGLPNRRLLLDRLQQALASSQRNRCHGALMFLDLDRFKDLNDTLGHDHGDLLLKEVAQRLREQVRQSDTVARFGGDEFVVIVAPLSQDAGDAGQQARRIAEKLRAALSTPVSLKGEPYRVTSSIGVQMFVGVEVTVPELLRRADEAMYAAKAAGRDTVVLRSVESAAGG